MQSFFVVNPTPLFAQIYGGSPHRILAFWQDGLQEDSSIDNLSEVTVTNEIYQFLSCPQCGE